MSEEMTVVPSVNPYSTGLDASGHSLEELFPNIDPEFTPFGSRVLIQVRRVFNKTKGGILLVTETKETEAWNIQVGRLIAMGPLAFKRRDTAEPWPEGMWAKVGEYVRVPRWGGDRWSVPMEDGESPVVIVMMNDSDLLGRHEGDPTKIKAYLA